MSELSSETPSKPDSVLTILWNRSTLIPSVRARYETNPGSRSPERRLMGKPEVGVNPIVVSTRLPPMTAVMLAPFPK